MCHRRRTRKARSEAAAQDERLTSRIGRFLSGAAAALPDPATSVVRAVRRFARTAASKAPARAASADHLTDAGEVFREHLFALGLAALGGAIAVAGIAVTLLL